MSEIETTESLLKRKRSLLADIKKIENDTWPDDTPGEVDGAMIAMRRDEIKNIDRILLGISDI